MNLVFTESGLNKIMIFFRTRIKCCFVFSFVVGCGAFGGGLKAGSGENTYRLEW